MRVKVLMIIIKDKRFYQKYMKNLNYKLVYKIVRIHNKIL
jgi:hypothetical protein